MCGCCQLQRGVEGENNRGAAGQFLLAIMLQPPNRTRSGPYTQADAGTHRTGNDCSNHDSGCGGEADSRSGFARMRIANDRSFVIDVGVCIVVEVRYFRTQRVRGAIGQADRLRLKPNRRRPTNATSAVDAGDAPLDDAAGGQKYNAVPTDI